MTLDELRAKAYWVPDNDGTGLGHGQKMVTLADAEAALAECEGKLAVAKEALISARCELNCLGRDLQEIYDGERQLPTALLSPEVMDEITSALNGCE